MSAETAAQRSRTNICEYLVIGRSLDEIEDYGPNGFRIMSRKLCHSVPGPKQLVSASQGMIDPGLN